MKKLQFVFLAVIAAFAFASCDELVNTVEDLNNYITSLVTANRVDGLIFLCVKLQKNMDHLYNELLKLSEA